MRPVKVKDQNADFAKPPDWDDRNGACRSLPLRREFVGFGGTAYAAHYSNWKPSAEELARLNAGGVVDLCCCGVQPAVSVDVVPCADPDEANNVPVLAEETLRGILAEELERNSEPRFAQYVRNGSDNSNGGLAAMSAMRRAVQVTRPDQVVMHVGTFLGFQLFVDAAMPRHLVAFLKERVAKDDPA